MRFALPLSFLAAACTPTIEVATLLAAGPHGVGYTEQTVTYDPGDGLRELRLAIWYPSSETAGPPVLYDGIFPAPYVFADTPMADGPFPLVVFSHGHQGYAESSGQVVSHLVRHGNIVVAPDHTDNTFFDGDNRTTDIYWKRPADISAVLDHVVDPQHFVGEQLDDAPILGIGHSFGGYSMQALGGATHATETLLPACESGENSAFCSTMTPEQGERFAQSFREPRIAGIASMAPGDHRLLLDEGLAAIEVPVLLMTGGRDDVEQGSLQWGGLNREGNFRVHVADAGHLAFTDFAPISDEDVEPVEMWSVLGAYLLAFQGHLAGNAEVRSIWKGREAGFSSTAELTVGE